MVSFSNNSVIFEKVYVILFHIGFLILCTNCTYEELEELHELDVKNYSLSQIGEIKGKTTFDIIDSQWSIGCETLDRDFSNFTNYRDKLVDLGAKQIRIQGGWSKTEKSKGIYDWQWLDNIINYSIGIGIKPWVQLSYGNPIYSNGGTSDSYSQLPNGDEAIDAWLKWVDEFTKRYNGKILNWEIWNEPDIQSKEINPLDYARLYELTATIIKTNNSNSSVYALSLANLSKWYPGIFLDHLKYRNKLALVDAITYHHYTHIPEEQYESYEKMNAFVKEFSSNISLIQGENGVPSKYGGVGALAGHDWNEISQAKWIIRRMLSDFVRGIETNIFTIADINYPQGINDKGLLKVNGNQVTEKISYSAYQNVASVFCNEYSNIEKFSIKNIENNGKTSFYHLYNNSTNNDLIIYWNSSNVPTNTNKIADFKLSFQNIDYNQPVLIDLLTGKIFEISHNHKNSQLLPIYDSPMLIGEKEDFF